MRSETVTMEKKERDIYIDGCFYIPMLFPNHDSQNVNYLLKSHYLELEKNITRIPLFF